MMIAQRNITSAPEVPPVPIGTADDLSFVTRDHARGGYDYWSVTKTASYGADCDAGRAAGEEFMSFLERFPTNGNLTLLGCIASDMIRHGQTSGHVIGFSAVIAENAVIGARFKSVLADAAIGHDLDKLMQTHRAARDVFEDAVKQEDGLVRTPVADAALGAECAAFDAILSYRAVTMVEVAAKAEYIAAYVASTQCALDLDQAALLLASMAGGKAVRS